MIRISSSLVASLVLWTATGCGDDPEPVNPGSLFDGGLVGQQQTCPTCVFDGGLGTLPDGAPAPACNALDPGACAAFPDCAPIYGLAYDATRYCRGENQLPVYCQAKGVECGFGPVRVVDPAGQRWLLSNKCVPPGYGMAPTEIHPIEWIEDYTVCPSAGLQTRCGQLDERGCAANPACFAQLGTQLNERRSCKQGSEHFVACVQNTTCNRVLTYARDPAGNTWELAGSCLPSGYSALPNSSVAAHVNWPSCAF
jgi:hypothetical protein